ncbi:MAG: ABC transporter permease [Spirochaetales bacterium]|nr:ABC transporter permease [Spirochaetales bacterium]
MIKKWVLWVSSRYINVNRRGRKISPGILSSVGIGVGVMALITVISVMNGFQMGFIEDILEISSYHIRISDITKEEAVNVRDLKGIKSIMPFLESQSLINTEYSMEPCLIKGIPADAEILDPAFFEHLNIVTGKFSPDTEGGILIGRITAYRMGVTIGDRISIIALNGGTFGSLRPENSEFTVTGIFKSGYNDFDSSLVVMSLASLFGIDDCASVEYGVKLENRFIDKAASLMIAAEAGIEQDKIVSWRSYNKSFFSALKLEKTMMFILLGLIFLVVSFGIFNSTRRTVVEKQEEIGIMRAIGSTPAQIRQIFVIEGLIIGLAGGLAGTAAGLLITLNINAILSVFAFNSGSFLINVPVRIVFGEVFTIFTSALLFCVFSAYAASRKVSRITPQEVLRYE